jgi:hypothetical protein
MSRPTRSSHISEGRRRLRTRFSLGSWTGRRLVASAAALHVMLAVALFVAGRTKIAPTLIDQDGIMSSFAYDSYGCGRVPPRPGYDGSPVLAECAAGGPRHRAFHPVAHASTGSERWLSRNHGSEFLARAGLRQSLFWISRARLQILRLLQIDDGYRIFHPR